MPLASEDRPFLRDLLHEIRDVQRETNVLLEEIRDLLKSPPVTIEGRPLTRGVGGTLIDAREAGECLRNLGDRPAQERAYAPGDTFSSRNGGRDLPKSPPGTFWFYRIQDDRYVLRQAETGALDTTE